MGNCVITLYSKGLHLSLTCGRLTSYEFLNWCVYHLTDSEKRLYLYYKLSDKQNGDIMKILTVSQLKKEISKKGVTVYSSARLFTHDTVNVEVKKVDILYQLNAIIKAGHGDDETMAHVNGLDVHIG